MAQAIITKYLAPNRNECGRIRATCYSSSVTIPYPHGLSSTTAHRAAAEALRKNLDWTGTLIGGSLPDESGYAFVFTDSES